MATSALVWYEYTSVSINTEATANRDVPIVDATNILKALILRFELHIPAKSFSGLLVFYQMKQNKMISRNVLSANSYCNISKKVT